jgi:hypothetical protein
MGIPGAQAQITQALTHWEGVTVAPHRFGGVEYRLESREIGHVHDDYLVDIPLPTKVRHALVAAGEAEPHHLLRDSGWVSFYIHEAGDVARAVALLQRSYDIALVQRVRRGKPIDDEQNS